MSYFTSLGCVRSKKTLEVSSQDLTSAVCSFLRQESLIFGIFWCFGAPFGAPFLGHFWAIFGPKLQKALFFARFQTKKQKPGGVQLDSWGKVVIFDTEIENWVNSAPFSVQPLPHMGVHRGVNMPPPYLDFVPYGAVTGGQGGMPRFFGVREKTLSQSGRFATYTM